MLGRRSRRVRPRPAARHQPPAPRRRDPQGRARPPEATAATGWAPPRQQQREPPPRPKQAAPVQPPRGPPPQAAMALVASGARASAVPALPRRPPDRGCHVRPRGQRSPRRSEGRCRLQLSWRSGQRRTAWCGRPRPLRPRPLALPSRQYLRGRVHAVRLCARGPCPRWPPVSPRPRRRGQAGSSLDVLAGRRCRSAPPAERPCPRWPLVPRDSARSVAVSSLALRAPALGPLGGRAHAVRPCPGPPTAARPSLR
jgi:hypothetical protein